MQSPELAVTCAALTRRFGPVVAVDGVDLQVPRGEIFALVGPDGAGKTTLMRLLCGLLRPDGGTAAVAGIDVLADPEAARRRLGYMPQRFSLYGDLTAVENLRLYAGLYQVPAAVFRERAERLLGEFRLLPVADRLAQHLSGGMRQKLALACTLVHAPEVLLLDEPTTGVDPVSRRLFWRILYDLNRAGLTVCVSTPYMDEAERCSRVGLMDRGRLIACDAPGALRAAMGGEILEVVAEPRAQARRHLRHHPLVRSLEVFGDRLHVLVDSARAAAPVLRAALEAEGVAVRGLHPVRPTLEDVFVARLTAPGAGGARGAPCRWEA
ncbi:MAG: ABC transporter ATP-binding protein [Armatimonadota bacterium]|nr:ABC transporter ATP-binding protein [Armatimonadota bacterium]MDR7448780.1 ABC transporter ATP-binding protein [Armatimonadota bacterium]MDR7459252.1 ABC transporter ATP-binding protein [Armatimonadota bacterium]MDR7479648.1 ABC transporter ATP-binding protein [Armatimonadota bacterium]MDR7489454.1 ABC transporter ATP-binding protein [Armatimonadota bacterium]